MNIRALSAQLISDVIDHKKSLNDRLPIYKNKCKNDNDKSLLQALTFGVLRLYLRYQFIIQQYVKKPLKEKDHILYYLLAIGMYQLEEMRVKDHAAISETVEAARILKRTWATGFLNAILREFQRNPNAFVSQIEQHTEAFTSHPLWLLQLIKKEWPNQFENIITTNNEQPPMFLRVNQQKVLREDYLNLL